MAPNNEVVKGTIAMNENISLNAETIPQGCTMKAGIGQREKGSCKATMLGDAKPMTSGEAT